MPNSATIHFSSRERLIAAAVSACFASASAYANPTVPQVVNGSASFNQAGKLLTVTNSNGAIINWNSFSIAAGETTRFNQASASSSVLNRVIANDPSVLLGTLSSNGRVWLVNPTGILVGQGAKIDVAGIVASTLNVRNEDFLAGRLSFGTEPNAGSIKNYGQIATPGGGSVYLIAPDVENHGIIHAPNGEIILAAGQTVQLLDTGTPGVRVDITGAEGSATNLGQIVAEAGRIGMAGVLLKNTGTLNASSLVREGGRIFLRASRDAYVDGAGRIVTTGAKGGSVEVLGANVAVAEHAVIDVSGDQQGGGSILLKADMNQGFTDLAGNLLAKGGARGGDGGFIETSGAHVKIADSARVNSSAPNGKAGTWLIDPTDYTIANSGGDITPSALATNLYGGNVSIETADAGTGYGDIYVNDAVSWASSSTLSLNAYRNINVNAGVSNSVGGSVVLRADKTGTGTGTVTFGQYGGVSLSGGGRADLYYNPSSYTDTDPYYGNVSGSYTTWMLINSVGQVSGGTVGLQAMDTNLAGNYALGKNIDASATSSWNSGAGFAPVGTNSDYAFSGNFDGLSHTITGLTINRPSTDNVGLFGYARSSSSVHNVGLVGGSVTGQNYVGALVGNYYGTGTSYSISNSFATAEVTGNSYVGGLVGSNSGSISDAYATGKVTSTSYGGGLVGENDYFGSVSGSYSSGQVSGSSYYGGLVGQNSGTVSAVSSSYWDSESSSQSTSAGGTPKTTAEMKQTATFSGWSIANAGGSSSTWRIYEGVTYPLLRSFLTPLTVTAISGSKVYDATDAGIGVSYSVTPDESKLLGTLSYSGGGKNVDSYSSVMPGGRYSDQQGYDISYASGALTVNPYAVSLSGSRVYDATANVAAGTLSIGTLVGSETLTLSGSGTVSDKNVGTSKAITLGSLALGDGSNGGLASNYTFTGGAQTLDITKAALTVSASGVNKVYDATTAASVTLGDNRLGSDALTLAYGGASFNDKNVGTAKPVSVTGIAVSGTDAGNYSFNTTASTSADITKAALTVSAGGVNKVYDATTAASVTLGDNRLGSDVLTLAYGAASFNDKNVGTGKPVSVTGIAVSGTDAGNYSFNSTASTSADITKAALTVSAGGVNKVYDATTAASVTLGDNRLGSDSLTLAYGAASFDDKNVGTGKPVSVTGIAVSGTDAGNYTFNSTANTSADITKAALTVSAGGVNKVYDATAAASVTLGDNRLGSDVLTLAYGGASFNDKNVGTAKSVSVTGIAVSGTDAGNYSFNSTASTSADISKAALTVSAGGVNKVYDATTAASVTLGDDRLGSDVLTLAYGGASFNDKNVGTAKPVSVTGIALGGTDAGNYTFNTTASTSADISKAALTVSAAGVNKVYDATTSASVTLGDDRLGSDTLTLAYGAASFDDKNVGTAKPVNVTGIALGGTDVGNYTFNTTASTSADISKAALTVSASGVNKVYDATTAASVTLGDNRLGSDALTLAYGAASFDDKNVGTAKPVNVTAIAVSGTDAGNYTFNTTASASADISKAALTVSASGVNKVYDATTSASVTLGDNRLSSDALTLAYGAASFDDKNVGTAKPVSVTGIAVSGTDAGNYTFNSTASASADITVRPLSTWIGGTSGNWSVAANWDALPDLSNVTAVSIPAGTSVTYDAAAGSTNLATLDAAGLAITGGNLNIAGTLTVNSSFSLSGGTLAFGSGASASITQASGNLELAAVELSKLSLSAPAGAIMQSGAIVAAELDTQSQSGTTLDNSGNKIARFAAANSGRGNVSLTNSRALTIAGIDNSGGNIAIDNTGAIRTTGAISAPAGSVSIVAHSPLTIGAGGVSAVGNITLTAGETVALTDQLTLNGPVGSFGRTGAIALSAGDDLVQNANVTTRGGAVSATAQRGNINMGMDASTSTGGGSIGYAAPYGNVVLSRLDAGDGSIMLSAGGSILPTPGFTGANLIGGKAVIVAGANVRLSTQVEQLDLTINGRYSITDSLTGALITDVTTERSTTQVLDQLVSNILDKTQQQSLLKGTQTTGLTMLLPPTTGRPGFGLLDGRQTAGGTLGSFGGGSADEEGKQTEGKPGMSKGEKEKESKKDEDKKKKEEESKKKDEDREHKKTLATCN